ELMVSSSSTTLPFSLPRSNVANRVVRFCVNRWRNRCVPLNQLLATIDAGARQLPRHERNSPMASHKRIFEGVRIIDVTQYLAGPVATRLFVDLGAEVIKVELPPSGEGSRRLRFSAGDGRKGAAATYFAMHNRGKKCVCVDFKRPAGAAVVKDLAKSADVLLENYTPGVLRRYGLGYDDIAAVNPNIVMCSVSTYGQDSPYAERI